jgi:excisionase family DNA binding protein
MRLTFTVHEVAGLLGVSSKLIYEEIQRGNIAAITLGRRRVIPKTEVERIIGPLEPASTSTTSADPEVARLLRLVAERMES